MKYNCPYLTLNCLSKFLYQRQYKWHQQNTAAMGFNNDIEQLTKATFHYPIQVADLDSVMEFGFKWLIVVWMWVCKTYIATTPSYHNHFTTLFPGPPGWWVSQQNFWTLWCKGRLTEADTPTIQLGATPSGLSSAHVHHPPFLQYLCWQGTLNSNTNQPTWTDCFTARRSYASAVLGVVILSVRPPVHPSVHLSVTRVLCD